MFEHCLHEGIALSNVEPGTVAGRDVVPDHEARDSKRVLIEYCSVAHCQQGIELGFSSAGLTATIRDSILTHNVVAVRYGDGYGWQAAGFLLVERVVFRHNAQDWLNLNPAAGSNPHAGLRTAFSSCWFSAPMTRQVLFSNAYLWDNLVWWTSEQLSVAHIHHATNFTIVGPRAAYASCAPVLPATLDIGQSCLN